MMLRKEIFPQGLLFVLAILFFEPVAFSVPIPVSVMPMPQMAKIRVRVAHAIARVEIGGWDLKLFQDLKHVRGSEGLGLWDVRCHEGKISAINHGPASTGKLLEVAEPLTVQSPAGFLKINGKPYRDEVQIYSSGSLCEVVNHVEIEKYLDGVVNSEFNSKWSDEATAAQVIAARTFAYYQVRQARFQLKSRNFDVDGTVSDQLYEGSGREDFRASQAVERTHGMVLIVAGAKEPLKAFYHSTCGGKTELPEHVWGAKMAGFKHSVICPYCLSSPRMKWDLRLTASELATSFSLGVRHSNRKAAWLKSWPANWEEILKRGRLTDLRVGLWDGEGHVVEVRSEWNLRGKIYDLKIAGNRFRDWLGPARLRSTSFQMTGVESLGPLEWRIDGRGNGHGVGMCQWGAKVMGERGFKAAAILKHYYPDANLQKLW